MGKCTEWISRWRSLTKDILLVHVCAHILQCDFLHVFLSALTDEEEEEDIENRHVVNIKCIGFLVMSDFNLQTLFLCCHG